nr:hypothetical protein [Candidatus Sigynarchaeota archaeon]
MEDTTKLKYYKLLLFLNSASDLERDILICLSHVYPKSISATQLATMIDVSIKARTLSRGVLKRLGDAGYILLDKLTPKLYSIRINHEDSLMSLLVDTCKAGDAVRESYLKKIENIEAGDG